MNIIVAILYTIITGSYLSLIWDIKRANPVFYFLIFHWIISIGSILLIDFNNAADQMYCIIIFISLFMFIGGSYLGIKKFHIRKKYSIFFNSSLEIDSYTSYIFMFLIVILSIIVILIYYKMIGYNLAYPMLFGAGDLDFKTARLATYSGEHYYAPGYVNQFKNVLLPTGFAIFSLKLFIKKRFKLFYFFTFFTFLFLLYALLGTGQRAPLLYSFVAIGMGLSIIYRIPLKWIILLLSIVIIGFGIISLNSGRFNADNGINFFNSFFIRIFYIDQHESLLGFRYIYSLDTTWFNEWLKGVVGILPGYSGSELDHILYSRLNGTTRGTSSLSVPGSVYYNGSVIYVFIMYFLFGLFYSYIYNRLISGKKTIIRSMGYGGIIFLLSVFVMGAPVSLLNKGLLGFILVLFLRKIRINCCNRENYKYEK